MPTVPFKRGEVLREIPQSPEDKEFAMKDLESGVKNGVYERVTARYARRQVRRGRLVSSAFTTWQGEGVDRRGRFVINLHQQSKHWPHRGVKMETLPSFSIQVEPDDHLMSWDFRSGYRHLRLHRDVTLRLLKPGRKSG